jgi:hypothetical protein
MRDFLGRKLSKKEVLEENQRSGKQSEILHVGLAAMQGKEAIRTTYVEVKSSSTAPLSELQKKTKKKKDKNYRVERIDPLFKGGF